MEEELSSRGSAALTTPVAAVAATRGALTAGGAHFVEAGALVVVQDAANHLLGPPAQGAHGLARVGLVEPGLLPDRATLTRRIAEDVRDLPPLVRAELESLGHPRDTMGDPRGMASRGELSSPRDLFRGEDGVDPLADAIAAARFARLGTDGPDRFALGVGQVELAEDSHVAASMTASASSGSPVTVSLTASGLGGTVGRPGLSGRGGGNTHAERGGEEEGVEGLHGWVSFQPQ